MKIKYKILFAIFIGITMGNLLPHVLFYHFFTTNSRSLLPWTIVGAILCYFLASNRKQSIIIGVSYTAALAESFLFLGQLKFNTELIKVLIFLLIMLVVASICGVIMGLTIFYIRKFMNRLFPKRG